MNSAVFDVLRKVTTATITTMLLKKGIRRCWMNGPKPLVPGGPRLIGPAFTLRFVPAREDLATPESWAKPISTRAAIEAMPEGVIAVADAMGVPDRRHLRRHPVRPHEEAQRHGARHRRRAARQDRRAGERAAGVVRRHGGAGLGQRAHLRRLERADRLRRRRDLPGRRHRGRRRRRRGDPARTSLEFVAHEGAEHELYESWVFTEVEKGVRLPGLYPPNDEAKARYADWRRSLE